MRPVFERLQRRQPQDKPSFNLNSAEYLVFFSRAACKLAGGYGTISGPPFWSFGGQEPKIRERWSPCRSARTERTCQPDPVRARSIGPGTLQQPPALGIASCSRLRHRLNCSASSAGSFQPKHRLATFFFLKPRCTVCETRSFYDDHTVFFDENSRSFCASWQVAEPLPERSRHQYPRSHFLEIVRRDLGDCQVCLFLMDAKPPERTCLPPHVCGWARACINFKIPFFLAYPLGSCLWKLRDYRI